MPKSIQRKVLRCYAERVENNQWQAFCLDLTLAVQGDSFSEVRDKLHDQIRSYVHEALTVDSEHAEELLNRQAPLAWRIKFQLHRIFPTLYGIYRKYRASEREEQLLFEEPLPNCA